MWPSLALTGALDTLLGVDEEEVVLLRVLSGDQLQSLYQHRLTLAVAQWRLDACEGRGASIGVQSAYCTHTGVIG